jgi:alpha-glucosidase (family GH31 glycosyl hydrolase)
MELTLFAQDGKVKIVQLKDGEQWFGGAVNDAHLAPFKSGYELNLLGDTRTNQAVPFLLSTKGRFIWSEEPFKFSFKGKKIELMNHGGTLVLDSTGRTLKEAFMNASRRYFPAQHKLPDTLLFTKPQYNTWIELVYNQNQQDILKYAKSIVANGFPPGVLMIDDNWADYYGRFDFRADRFTNAASMLDTLHQMGFKVMIWVSPFISPDTEVFRELRDKKYLLFDGSKGKTWAEADQPVLVNWWNGSSAVMDFTNPEAITWFHSRLDYMVQKYHIDGFKFDAGDAEFYPEIAVSFKNASRLWGDFGTFYPLNEYRAMWKRGGEPLVQRLRDKKHSWEDLQKLVPDLTAAGLMGYQFACPDMIGGGEYGSFIGRKNLDEELIVRSAQCSALMPMMQFSVAPWRVLSPSNLAIVKKAIALRKKLTPYLMTLVRAAAETGEPIARTIEYQFPQQGFENLQEQFMLGEKYLVAPVVTKSKKKTIFLPKGKWKNEEGKVFTGPLKLTQMVALDRLPVFELLK